MRRSEVTRALYAQAPRLASDFLREMKKSARNSFDVCPAVAHALFLNFNQIQAEGHPP